MSVGIHIHTGRRSGHVPPETGYVVMVEGIFQRRHTVSFSVVDIKELKKRTLSNSYSPFTYVIILPFLRL